MSTLWAHVITQSVFIIAVAAIVIAWIRRPR